MNPKDIIGNLCRPKGRFLYIPKLENFGETPGQFTIFWRRKFFRKTLDKHHKLWYNINIDGEVITPKNRKG
jgi:hypothetical protein